MSRFLFPEDRTSYIYQGPNQPILTPPRTAIQLFEAAHGSELADVQTTTGFTIEDSIIYTGTDGLIPEFYGPDGVPRLWGWVLGTDPAARYPLQAQYHDLLANHPPGTVLLAGDGPPPASEGNPGDWWVDTTNHVLYGPRSDMSWPDGMELGAPPDVDRGPVSYTHSQLSADDIWTIEHPLSFRPGGVAILDSFGEEVEAEVQYDGPSRIVVTFSLPMSGTAILS